MKAFVYLLSIVIGSLSVLTQAAEPVPVQIKSVRKCGATVEKTEDCYIIDVKMEPIDCFDLGTNELLSFEKANNLALYALLQYLNPDKKNASLSCSGMQTIKSEFSEKVCHVVCRIPQNGVEIIDAPVVAKQTSKMKTDSTSDSNAQSKANSKPKIVSSKSSILTKQADYEETIDKLADILVQSAPQCVDSSEKFVAYKKAVANFEAKFKKQYDQLETTIQQDCELLTIEKTELFDVLAQSQDKPMQRLKELKKCAQEIETIDKLTNILLQSAPQCVVCSEDLDGFRGSLADYKKRIERQFAQLKRIIEQDNELLSSDKSKLLDLLAQSQNKPMLRLNKLAKCAQELETIKDFESEPEFAEYLLSNPFYRNHGKVEIYRTSAGYGLISMGKAVVTQKGDDTPAAILLKNSKKVAELRAKAELAGAIEGAKIEKKETYTKTVEIKSNGTEEEQVLSIDDYSRIIHESTSAFLKHVRPVASWRSADGKIVYVVLGMFREKK